MIYLFVGSIGFLLFIVYDLNNITLHNKLLKTFFAVGCILIIFSTVKITLLEPPSFSLSLYPKIFISLGLLISFVLLIYTLFFALPLKGTYISLKTNDMVIDYGMYALCRHPGVLWFFSFYLFLWLFSGNQLIFWAGIVFSALNVLYIIFQEKYIFLRMFIDYESYQKSTPFLIPNPSSVRNCFISMKVGKEIRHEV